MRRREFVAGAGCVVAASSRPLRAQPVHSPTIGVLAFADPEPFWSIFREALKSLGYVEGRNIRFEFRAANGNVDRTREFAAELVRLKVDMIVASLTPAAAAAKAATSDIPIVMAGAGDPLATGLVSSLSAPGGNVTGMSATAAELGGKLLELLRDMLPAVRRVSALTNPSDSFTAPFLRQLEYGSRTLGIPLHAVPVDGAGGLERAFAAVVEARADALVVQPSLPRRHAAELALRHRLPTIAPIRSFPAEGGLMSYSANQSILFGRAAMFVDRILKGDKPGDLPVEQPTRFDLVINAKTAKVLGLAVPATLLARADEIIE